jgi:hypothetical protein
MSRGEGMREERLLGYAGLRCQKPEAAKRAAPARIARLFQCIGEAEAESSWRE